MTITKKLECNLEINRQNWEKITLFSKINPNFDFDFFQTNCQPHITEAAKNSVEGICRKMYNSSCDYAQKIQEKNAEILRENGISGKFYNNSLVNTNLFYANFTNTQYAEKCTTHLVIMLKKSQVNFTTSPQCLIWH